MVINGRAHGPGHFCTTCEVRMRTFNDGDEIWIEPFRSAGFPLVKDLMVDRSAFDRIIESGGYITVHSGPKPDPNSIPIPHHVAGIDGIDQDGAHRRVGPTSAVDV